MTQQDSASTSNRTFLIFHLHSEIFPIFFPDIYFAFEAHLVTQDRAEYRAYCQFCEWVASIAGCIPMHIARTQDFQHDVLLRFEIKKLADRYDLYQNSSPARYVRGVARMMMLEQNRKLRRSPVLALPCIVDDTIGPDVQAQIREIVSLVNSLMDRLTPAQRHAIERKYGHYSLSTDTNSRDSNSEYVHRSRGIAKLRQWLAEMGTSSL